MRKSLIVIAWSSIAVLLVCAAFAQTPATPPPVVELSLLERAKTLLEALLASGVVGSISFMIAMIGRALPFIPNKVVPAIAIIGNIIGLASQVLNKLVEAATGVAYKDDMDVIHYAGLWGGLHSILAFTVNAALSALMLKVQRGMWEDGVKQVIPKTADK